MLFYLVLGENQSIYHLFSIVGPLVVVVLGCSMVVVPFLTCCLVSSIVSVLTESVGVVVVANLVV